MFLHMQRLLLALVIVLAFSSCRLVRPSVMLKTPRNYAFDKISDTMSREEYHIAPTDAISFRLLSNEGFKMIENDAQKADLNYNLIETTVESDGTIKAPVIGRVKMQGLTIREAEQLLETMYSEYYVGAYTIVKVTNKRVFVFPGGGGTAKIVPLTNNNTTVFEALAAAGGIQDDGKAFRVKLVRKAEPKPRVYRMDLSTIDGLKDGNVVVQANDIIYVEAKNRVGRELRAEFIPYVSLLTSVMLMYAYISRF